MPTLYRTDQASIKVTIGDILSDSVTANWDKLDGGDNVSPGQNYLPGGMAPAVELGGLPKRSNLTVERAWTDSLIQAYKKLDEGAGKLLGTITYAVLAKDGVTVVDGSVLTYTGVLLETKRPGYDSQSSNVAMLSLTFGLNAGIG